MRVAVFCVPNKRLKWAIAQVLTLLVYNGLFGQNHNDEFHQVVARSTLIFQGTVRYMDSSNLAVRVASQKRAIVLVDSIIDITEQVPNMKGREVTLVFASDTGHASGDKQIFYSFAWYYGRTLGLKEIKNTLDKTLDPQLKQEVLQARSDISDDSLFTELKRATVVVHAVVRDVGQPLAILGSSEHDPMLCKTRLDVKEVLKGSAGGDTVFTFYASSHDVAWITAPKFSIGVEGIFLLHDHQEPILFNEPALTTLDPRDFQPIDRLNKVKDLLKLQ